MYNLILLAYVPAIAHDHAPSLWSDTQRYTEEHAYQQARDDWFDRNIASHQPRDLNDLGWCHHDAEIFLNHIGREALHCAKDRAGIVKAWSKKEV